MAQPLPLTHIFIDHSNMWGGARLASRVKHPSKSDGDARISVPNLDRILGGTKPGVTTKIVSGGVPPGMEGLWQEYQNYHYDTQRLFRDEHWKERGVDHSIIGHMWRLAAKHLSDGGETIIVLASGDGKRNEFGTSFLEVIEEILFHERYTGVTFRLASFDWKFPGEGAYRSPTNQRMRSDVEQSDRGTFINLMDHYDRLVYHDSVKPQQTTTPNRSPQKTRHRRRAPQLGR